MKVCVFGDSIAKGVIYDEEKKRYAILKDSIVNMVQERTDIEINNYACFGCTVTKGFNLLEKVEGELKDCEYTFIEFGGNDCDFKWSEVAQNPDINHDCNTPLEVFKEKYKKMIERVWAAGSRPVLITLPPIDSKRFFNWVSKGLNKDNILKFLGDVEHIGRWQSAFNDAVHQLSGLFGLPVLDIRSIFFKQNNFTDYLCEDGIHPNKEGHKLMYTAIAERTNLIPLPV
ncbi:MAG: SGNH/GDSL hydrolase family protein [Firmicutes bacterium HGW-Firmicutes-21]|nr:MAG: SGNH/GDSL hydrolase family protein [Firmicutes bacterium HGW-Firmicutes-21]